MANARKHRGMQTQVLVAENLRSIFPYATSVGASQQGKDILHTEGFAIEVKARTNFDPAGTLRQASKNAEDGELPVAVVRMNGQGPAGLDDWVAFMRWGDLKELIRCHVENRQDHA